MSRSRKASTTDVTLPCSSSTRTSSSVKSGEDRRSETLLVSAGCIRPTASMSSGRASLGAPSGAE